MRAALPWPRGRGGGFVLTRPAGFTGAMSSLHSPLRLRHGRDLPNRLALAPMTNTQSHPDGSLSDMDLAWLLARAHGGFGLTLTAATYVNRAGKAWAGQPGATSDQHLPGLERLAHGVRQAGGVSSVQLHHGGERANPDASGEPAVAPWDNRESGVRALTTGEVNQVVDDFAAAAALVERAGIDGIEIHGAHGYLLCQFLDGSRNTRQDAYGGDFGGRTRIIHEVIDAVRNRTHPGFQVGLRLSPERFGLDPDEMVRLAADVLRRGDLDYLDLSLWDVNKLPAGAEDGPLLVDPYLDLPRHGTALAVAGRITSASEARAVLDRGADLALVGKAAIADRNFARHAVADPTYRAPSFPVSRDHLRSQMLGEPFVTYFANGWAQLVSD